MNVYLETPKYCLNINSNNELSSQLFTKTTAYMCYIPHIFYTHTHIVSMMYVQYCMCCVYIAFYKCIYTHLWKVRASRFFSNSVGITYPVCEGIPFATCGP